MNSTINTTSRHIYSVSELNNAARQILDIELPQLWLEGEISNLARPGSGHWYFSLKDENAQIRCAMFRRANSRITFNPENGDKVLVRGKVSLYEARGDYQLIADQMEDAGTGALQRAFEQLRDKLNKEGLFAAEHKKELPKLPRKIGIITSGTGAALHDILHVLERRMPLVEIKVYPVLVQGEQAPQAITSAIKLAESENSCDLLIIGRGGGSLEDLWAFNDEAVARAAFNCHIPVISAVGHEVDFTILDFVADLRAPTPSAAAELATPLTIHDLLKRLSSLQEQAHKTVQLRLQNEAQKIDHIGKRLQLAHPGQWVVQQQQRLNSLSQRLQNLSVRVLGEKKHLVRNLMQRFMRQDPENTFRLKHEQFMRLKKELEDKLLQSLNTSKQRLFLQSAKLDTLSPLATLDRGYAVVQLEDDKIKNKVVTSIKDVNDGDAVTTQLKDGKFVSTITRLFTKEQITKSTSSK